MVAGSFGKTTSVSMMAHCLASERLDPSWMIGAVLCRLLVQSDAARDGYSCSKATNIRPPTPTISRSSCTIVLRACCWRRSRMTTLTSFRRSRPISLPSHQLFDLVPRDGLIVAATSGDLRERFLAEAKRDVATFGLARGDWRAESIEYRAVSRFTLIERGREIVRVKTTSSARTTSRT